MAAEIACCVHGRPQHQRAMVEKATGTMRMGQHLQVVASPFLCYHRVIGWYADMTCPTQQSHLELMHELCNWCR